jgi:hypothetical protein
MFLDVGWSDPVPGRVSPAAVDLRLFTAHCNGDIRSTENLVHADLLKHEQPELSLPVRINALASDVSRGFRGICPSSGRFVPWNM